MAEFNIQLSEDEIERLINGEIIEVPTDMRKGKSNINKINILPALAADAAAPVFNRERKAVSQADLDKLNTLASIGAMLERENIMRLGS